MSEPPEFLPVDQHFETKAIHAAYNPTDNPTLGVVPPIILSSTFHQNDITKPGAFKYGRIGNPNREMLEKTIAALENGKYASCFGTGVAAIAMVITLLGVGDNILCIDDVYGGTHEYLDRVAVNKGVSVTYANLTDVNNVDKNVNQNTKMIWLESPTNPLLKILDLKLIAQRAKSINRNILVVVDNSFLSPYFQKPLELGADLVATSLTKYVNGHADVLMGCVITNNKTLFETFNQWQGVIGAVPSPFDCYLVLRGLKTLGIRMKVHMCNAYRVADYLQNHKMVEKVNFPGFPTHPGFKIAQEQWHGVSGMLSFYLKGGFNEAAHFLKSLKLFSVGVSYGGYESLAELPMIQSHAGVDPEKLKAVGVTGNLIRLSIGLETVDDIIDDLEAAFQSVSSR